MLPDRVSNPGHLTYKSVALQIVLRSPSSGVVKVMGIIFCILYLFGNKTGFSPLKNVVN